MLGLAMAAHGQQAPTANPNQRMNLCVVANDKSGNPVAGLQQQDFTLLDNKQPQQIVSFEAAGQRASAQHTTEIVLVLDAVNTGYSRLAYAREQMENFLKEDAGKLSHPVSLAVLTDKGIDMQPAGSTDGNAEAAYLGQRITGLRILNRSQGYWGAVDRNQISLNALGQLTAYESKKPGRKLVIWVSPGWALLSGPRMQLTNKEQQWIFDTSLQLSDAMAQARITLYMVNPLGTNEGLMRTYYYQQFLKPLTKPNQAQIGNLGLQVFAEHSGGRVLQASNDITSELRRCAHDASAYYVLSFDPPRADGPNFFNAIDVKIKGGLKAQTLYGFYEQPGR
jgi:VWFA-related protein